MPQIMRVVLPLTAKSQAIALETLYAEKGYAVNEPTKPLQGSEVTQLFSPAPALAMGPVGP